ncbi:MAG: response regulator transcription factor [Ignavibacteria bacterium]|nr:response regulator transcription factor [Ignavibacteria bacterium]
MKLKKQSDINVFLINDYQLICKGINCELAKNVHLFNSEDALWCFKELNILDKSQSEIIVLDISLPPSDGIIAAEKIFKKKPGSKIIIISSYVNYYFIKKLFSLGIKGYVFRDSVPNELQTAIEIVNSGSEYFCKGLKKEDLKKLTDFYQLTGLDNNDSNLTKREVEVLVLLVAGSTNKEISQKLNISIRTVETHREHIHQKLDMKNLAKLTQYAYQKGYLELKTD